GDGFFDHGSSPSSKFEVRSSKLTANFELRTSNFERSNIDFRPDPQEIPEQVLPVPGEDRLGVELNALDRVLAVADGHDDAALRAGGDLEAVGNRLGQDRERVVADRLERAGQAGEDA